MKEAILLARKPQFPSPVKDRDGFPPGGHPSLVQQQLEQRRPWTRSHIEQIGPVVDGHEADYGETFWLGANYEYKKICDAQIKVFEDVRDHWRKTQDSGPLLYEFAKKRADLHGYVLNVGQDGHRIGDFPHHVHFRGGLAECEEAIIPNAWILEIHLWDRKKEFGAFFEDLLSDQTFPPS
jgi:hypothetical protein